MDAASDLHGKRLVHECYDISRILMDISVVGRKVDHVRESSRFDLVVETRDQNTRT